MLQHPMYFDFCLKLQYKVRRKREGCEGEISGKRLIDGDFHVGHHDCAENTIPSK